MKKKYSKKELLEILNKILTYENVLEDIRDFQNILWGDDNGEDLYDLEEGDSEIMLDLALDLDFFGKNVPKTDKESGIKDIKDDKEELLNLVKTALKELTKSQVIGSFDDKK